MPPPNPHSDHAAALLALVLAGGRTAPRRQLLQRHGDPIAALAAGPLAWREAGCSDAQVAHLCRPDPMALAGAMAWLEAEGHWLVGWHDGDYPALLRRVTSPPLALFVDGDPALLWHPAVAVVGSRTPTAGGRDNARAFTQALAASGLAITSGMAAGVDAVAHETVLDHPGGITVAVLGTGPDIAYPPRHHTLRERIAGHGAVVSEHPPGTGPRPPHFPARNRLIAGLSLGTLVIEAALRSGALITARLAAEAGREVFAVPGSIHNPMARGCHRLIRDGATLVQEAGDILNGIAMLSTELASALRERLSAPIEGSTVGAASTPPLAPDYKRLWQALGHDPTPMDSLIERTGLTAAALSSMLLTMELEGRVVAEHGRYTRHP